MIMQTFPTTTTAAEQMAADLASLPAGERCPDCGDPSPGGETCAACREWAGTADDFVIDALAVLVTYAAWADSQGHIYHCAQCGAVIPEADADYSNDQGDGVCAACYERHYEPFEMWAADGQFIGFNFDRKVVTHGAS